MSTGGPTTPSSSGETPILMSTGGASTPLSTGETPIPLTSGSTPTEVGLLPYLLTTKEPTGLMPYLLSSVNMTKEPVTTAPTTEPPPPPPPSLPSVPDYVPSSKPKPLKYCKCRPGFTTTPAPTPSGLTPYLVTTGKPGLTPILLTNRPPTTTRRPHVMTTKSAFGFTGMTSGSPSRFLRRRGQLLKMLL